MNIEDRLYGIKLEAQADAIFEKANYSYNRVEETEDVSQKLEYLEYAEKLYIAILRKWRDNHRNNQREIGKKIRSIKSIRKELGGQNE